MVDYSQVVLSVNSELLILLPDGKRARGPTGRDLTMLVPEMDMDKRMGRRFGKRVVGWAEYNERSEEMTNE